MKKITEKLKKAFQKSTHLYICRYCGEQVLLPTVPNVCPVCSRMQTDRVTDLDTGVVIGGEPVMRSAGMSEQAVYMVKQKVGRKKDPGPLGKNTVIVVMRNGE